MARAKQVAKSQSEVLNSEEFKQAVRGAMGDIEAYSGQLQGALGLSEEEAKRKIAQAYYQNIKWAQDPVAAAQHLLAKQMTYMSVMEQIDPEAAIRDIDTQIKLMDSVRKNIKLVGDMRPKEVNVKMQGKDDAMPLKFIDIEDGG